MKAGGKISQQHQLNFVFASLEASLAVCRERFAQESLSVRRFPRTQRGTEARRLVTIEMGIVTKEVNKAGELAANFLKDLLVASGNGIASVFECCGRIECPKNCLAGHVSRQFRTDALEMARNVLESG